MPIGRLFRGIGRAVKSVVAPLARAAAPIVSAIPGVGTAVGAALSAVGSLAGNRRTAAMDSAMGQLPMARGQAAANSARLGGVGGIANVLAQQGVGATIAPGRVFTTPDGQAPSFNTTSSNVPVPSNPGFFTRLGAAARSLDRGLRTGTPSGVGLSFGELGNIARSYQAGSEVVGTGNRTTQILDAVQSGARTGGLAAGVASRGNPVATAGGTIGGAFTSGFQALTQPPTTPSSQALTIPGATMPNNQLALALLDGGRSGNKRAVIELALASGAFEGILRAPIVYQASDGSGRTRYGSDKGYVLVKWMNGGQRNVAQMPKAIARSLGLWRPRKKPVISVKDSNAIRRSNTAKKRLAKVTRGAGLFVYNKRPERDTTKRRTTRRR